MSDHYRLIRDDTDDQRSQQTWQVLLQLPYGMERRIHGIQFSLPENKMRTALSSLSILIKLDEGLK